MLGKPLNQYEAMPKAIAPRFRIQRWYALVAVYDTRQKGYVWHRQCPHEDVPAAIIQAQAWIDDPQPMLLPPLDPAFDDL